MSFDRDPVRGRLALHVADTRLPPPPSLALPSHGNPDLTFAYVPSHLQQMTFELVKNSLRAVQEKYSDSHNEAPPIHLVVAEGIEDITIKVGVCRSRPSAAVTHRRGLTGVFLLGKP